MLILSKDKNDVLDPTEWSEGAGLGDDGAPRVGVSLWSVSWRPSVLSGSSLFDDILPEFVRDRVEGSFGGAVLPASGGSLDLFE